MLTFVYFFSCIKYNISILHIFIAGYVSDRATEKTSFDKILQVNYKQIKINLLFNGNL